ncbi:MAG: DegT/DnrJ/EryC1/StrS family aminotransferase [Vicinamibacteria bacterium]|nr:DegT/DnrJ/EryC1/StrS family aminotransferase [Vicinamibacteria bacterium]
MTEPGTIPMIDLKAQHARVRAEVETAIRSVLESARFIKGEECDLFEREFAAYCGAAHACGVANGTDALTLALRAYGVGPGDEVVTVANTFIATGEAILLNGARPVFVDVDPATFTMDPEKLRKRVTKRTKVIIPVHLYGHPAAMSAILDEANRRGIPVLEDAAQAHGAEIEGKRVGSLGHAACFSFYPSKNLAACGDAGMITSNDREFVDRVRRIADHGAGRHRYENLVLGTNSRLDTIQAAILRVKLRYLDRWTDERRQRVRMYDEAFAGVPEIRRPRESASCRSVWCLYTIRAEQRDELQRHLTSRRIATAVHYPRPIHLQPAMAAAGGKAGDLPVSEQLGREVLSIPLYPELSDTDLARVTGDIRSFYGRG